MQTGYFKAVIRQTATRLWINNPTAEDVRQGIEAGAIHCTTNPTYAAKMLSRPESHDMALSVVDDVLVSCADDDKAAALIQRRLVAEMARGFMPLYESSQGREGLVSIQMDPRLEKEAAAIVAEALADFEAFPNCIAKIPVIPSGLQAIDCLVRLNKPVIATEIMGIAQALEACAVYRRASEESGFCPAFFVTHISGILDDELKAEAQARGVEVSPEAMYIAGCAVAKKQYRIMQERGLPGILLGGGARGPQHFTEMLGGPVHVTLNWAGTALELEQNPPALEPQFDRPAAQELIDELKAKLPTFARAYDEEGLKPGEFHDFPPVVRFRNQFLKGWEELLATIRERRDLLTAPSPQKLNTSGESGQETSGKLSQQVPDAACISSLLQNPPDGSPLVGVQRSYCKLAEHQPVEIRPGIYRSTLVYNAENMLCHFFEKAGARVDLHTHYAVQSGYVLRGKLMFFDAEGNEHILLPGQGYLFASNEAHGSVALEESEIIETFTPGRPEYLDKE